MDLGPGSILLGKYRVDEVLGTGGMGRVVRASHLYLQQSVAIKILLPEMADSASTVSRFLREAQSTVRLKSEHIARVIDVGTTPDGGPFMVMEFLDGNDLNQVLRHHGPQPPQVVCDLMLQACEGLAEAHSIGIVHRDIKPSNFFITRRNDGSMLLKILDFGISKTPHNVTELTGTQTIIGTPTYMAPEQMKSGKATDPRSDIWSMGVVMYQLLNGRPPFVGETYAELVIKVNSEPPAPILVPLPAGLGEVILRCLEKDPRHRLQNVGELARMLAPFASDPISAQQSAGRASRILTQRPSMQGQQGSPLAAGGGLATPVSATPAHLTPRSWPPTGTSISQGAGQMTVKTRGGRAWLIAGVASLVILAGAGGYIASEVVNRAPAHVAAAEPPPPAPPSAPTPSPAPSAPTPSPAPSAPTPSPAPSAPTPSVTQSAPTPSPAPAPTTASAPTPSPAPSAPPPSPAPSAPPPSPAAAPTTPRVTQSAPTPSVTQSAPTPSVTASAPTPSGAKPVAPKPTVAEPTVAKPVVAKAKKPVTTTTTAKKPKAKPKKVDEALFDGRK